MLVNAFIFISLFINPILQPYVTMFEHDYGQRIREMRIEFSDNMLPGVMGMCLIWESPRRIIINAKYWDSLTEAQKKQSIYHELGHCELNRKHVENGGVMEPNAFDDYHAEDWNNDPEPYIEELFKEDVPKFEGYR